jgi:uncharacterized membrane protein YfcA
VTALAIGLVAGLFSVLFGVGGGLVMVPGMVYLLRIRPHRAIGTSLAVILPTAVVGVLKYLEHPALRAEWDWWVVAELALGGVLGALLGALLANALRGSQLKRLFGVFVILTGMYLVYRAGREYHLPSTAAHASAPGALMVVVGIVVGLVSGLLGVGGGVVTVPALGLALGYAQRLAQGVSLAVIVPVSLSAAVAHQRRGNVISSLAGWMAVGAMVGAQVMGEWVHSIPNPLLRGMFGGFLILMGVTMVSSRKRHPEVSGANG